MSLSVGDTYWTYDDGTADIVSRGKIGEIRQEWVNGVRNNLAILYKTGYRQSTPSTPFILSVYRYNEWVEIDRHTPLSYKDWVVWNLWIQGYYNRWFRVEFDIKTVYFRIGEISNPDFIPWIEEELEVHETIWEKAIETVQSYIQDLTLLFEKESLRVDVEFETSKKNLADSLEIASTDTEKKISEANDSLFVRFKSLLDNGLKAVTGDVREIWNTLESISTNLSVLYEQVGNTINALQALSDTLKAIAVDTIISYAWYVIDRILESEIDEQESNENGRDIYRIG